MTTKLVHPARGLIVGVAVFLMLAVLLGGSIGVAEFTLSAVAAVAAFLVVSLRP